MLLCLALEIESGLEESYLSTSLIQFKFDAAGLCAVACCFEADFCQLVYSCPDTSRGSLWWLAIFQSYCHELILFLMCWLVEEVLWCFHAGMCRCLAGAGALLQTPSNPLQLALLSGRVGLLRLLMLV
ncbi:hypothetical protein Nepgr_012453 [Nepenthes gracilis]|uniref:Uncharacterized protein n=1 Tax=Nepenthes gracilis TaxID=150966 RepID=A0AAD3SG53_NEPGR|nr:hypothetical protein Nepgr_012453 [Nepenthes gracilis]